MNGLKAIAGFEAAKGVVVLLLGAGVYGLHHVAHHLGVEHSREYAGVFVELFNSLGDRDILYVALLAFFYSVLRFVEAYGLWKEKSWAEWFAIFSGAIYLPFEVMKLMEGFAWWKVLITAVNIAVVAYLIYFKSRRGFFKAAIHR
jgi:uncharacterized membrane protein (DUF2068 family)